jgi:hypothetical protein
MFQSFRRWQRYSISAKALVKRLDAGSPKGLIAQVATISQGGMGFYTDVALEKATPVSVELLFRSADGSAQGVIEGKIASICSQGKDYFTGVAFDNEIPYDRFYGLIY